MASKKKPTESKPKAAPKAPAPKAPPKPSKDTRTVHCPTCQSRFPAWRGGLR